MSSDVAWHIRQERTKNLRLSYQRPNYSFPLLDETKIIP